MKKLLFLGILALGVCGAKAEEKIVLPTPYDPDPRSTSALRVNGLHLYKGRNPSEAFVIVELSSGTIKIPCSYSGQNAWDDINALNKANLTSNTLNKRVMNKVVSLGCVSGTVEGDPD